MSLKFLDPKVRETKCSFFGDVVKGLFDIGGGLLGAAQNRQQQRAEWDQQIYMAKNATQFRVEDAKKAGIHPLYALGANLPQASPGMILDDPLGRSISSAGQSMGDAVGKLSGTLERQRHDHEMLVLRAQAEKDSAIAAYYDSERARAAQANNASQSPFGNIVPESGQTGMVGEPVPPGFVRPTAPEVNSAQVGRPFTEAGQPPGTTQYKTGPGMTQQALSQKLAEAMESQGFFRTLGQDMQESGRFGSLWKRYMIEKFKWDLFGVKPSVDWTDPKMIEKLWYEAAKGKYSRKQQKASRGAFDNWGEYNYLFPENRFKGGR